MKRIIPILFCALLVALASCQKKNAPLFRGDYSFKTSGSVTLDEINAEDEPASFTVSLPNEIGQLEISALDNGKDSVLVVMNTMGGEVVVTHAFCKDNEIFLRDFKKNTLLFTGDSIALNKDGCWCFFGTFNYDSQLNKSSLRTLERRLEGAPITHVLTSHNGYTTDSSSAFAHIGESPDLGRRGFVFDEDAPYDCFA